MCSELQVVKITETFFMAFFFYAGKGTDAELRLNEKQIKTALKKMGISCKKLAPEKGCTNKIDFI